MKIWPLTKFLYRAASDKELEDIKIHGLRTKPGGFEFGKLFALSHEDANKYGEIISLLDGLSTTIIKVKISPSINEKGEVVEANGMKAILIEKEYLNFIKVIF